MALRSKVIRLAATLPADSDLRRSLLAALAREAKGQPSYKDYVERKKKKNEKPLPEDQWEARVKGQGQGKKPSKGKESNPFQDKEMGRSVKSLMGKADKGLRAAERLEKQVERLTSYKHSNPAKAQEVTTKLVGAVSDYAKSFSKTMHQLHGNLKDMDIPEDKVQTMTSLNNHITDLVDRTDKIQKSLKDLESEAKEKKGVDSPVTANRAARQMKELKKLSDSLDKVVTFLSSDSWG